MVWLPTADDIAQRIGMAQENGVTEEEIDKALNEAADEIMAQEWYEIDGYTLCVYADNMLLGESGITDEEYPENMLATGIDKIDKPLKRWSVEDGFYHA